MKKRITWLVVSVLVVLSLVLASCAPKVTEEKREVVTEKKEAVVEKKEAVAQPKEVVAEKKEVEMVADALGRLVPKPQYGGWLNLAETTDPPFGFSRSGLNRVWPAGYMKVTNDTLLFRDRLKGPAGSGEWTGLYLTYGPVEDWTGGLAESWEIIQPDTIKFKIRKGVRWQDKAPTYGAQLRAEDVVYTFLARWSGPWSTSGYARMYPLLSNLKSPVESIYIEPADPWVVVMKSPPGQLGVLWEVVAGLDYIVPSALGPIEGEGFGDWQGVVGTGPMLLTDYVMGSSITWRRNPDYWLKDQFHPENQLPYLDGVKLFIIPDLSTQYAALRTGKIDIIRGIEAEDAESLIRSNPELLWKEKWGGAGGLSMRNDVAPFNDVRVRRAMMMAINYDEIVRDYYKGKAEKFYWPPLPIPEHKLAYRPLSEMPESVKELYGYHPDKAKQLLAEAGYPKGFTTSITLSSAEEKNIDLASVVAAYWAKVGVTLKLDIKEPAVASAMKSAKTYPHGTWGGLGSPANFVKFQHSRVGPVTNYSLTNEPLIEATYKLVAAAYFDYAELSRIQREATPALQDLATVIMMPMPLIYNVWQPWVKGYHGEEQGTMYIASEYPLPTNSRYVWIDQELKKTITGKR